MIAIHFNVENENYLTTIMEQNDVELIDVFLVCLTTCIHHLPELGLPDVKGKLPCKSG